MLARSSSKWGAAYLFDGPGSAAVSGFYNAFDAYMNSKALDEYRQMAILANGAMLKTAPESATAAGNVAHTGLGNILATRSPNHMQGDIVSVQHKNEGASIGTLWKPTESYSDVTIRNTGSEPAQYQIVANYLAQTTRLKFVPWATLWFDVESSAITVAPGGTGTLRVPYLSGGIGYTPRADSSIEFFLVATNQNGAIVVDTLGGNPWQPTSVAIVNSSALAPSYIEIANPQIIDAPLVSIAGAATGESQPKGVIWVNNPFTSSVLITVTQPTPLYMTQVDAGTGRVEGNNIVWTTYVAPESSEMLTYTARLNLRPSTSVVLPSTQLALQSPTGIVLSDTVAPRAFTMPGFNVYLPLARK